MIPMPTSRAIFASKAPIALVVASTLLLGCAEHEPDAYGNFEAIEVVVSAEVAGQLTRFEPEEGDPLAPGVVVGQIDTTGLALQREELIAEERVLEAQIATAREEHGRTLRLYRAEAATARQLDEAEGEVRVLGERIAAARVRIEQISERIEKSRITNPLAGTVLVTYIEPGEFAQAGAPLYKIADLDTLILRAYVGGPQLAGLRLGQQVQVQIDVDEDELVAMPGQVIWIASEAEFTPTPIQTREERTDLVYAVKIHVPNPDGVIKIGMPAEVIFPGRLRNEEAEASPPSLRPPEDPGT